MTVAAQFTIKATNSLHNALQASECVHICIQFINNIFYFVVFVDIFAMQTASGAREWGRENNWIHDKKKKLLKYEILCKKEVNEGKKDLITQNKRGKRKNIK